MVANNANMVPQEELKIDSVELHGQTVFLTRQDPFGMIYLSLPQGTLPAKYSGAYSRVEAAQHAALTYAEEYKATKATKKR